MRNKRFDQQYIVNLTKQLCGASVLAQLSEYRASHPDAMYLYFFEKLKAEVRKMNPETLGLICEFAEAKDFSEPLGTWTGFIRKTGIEQVHPYPFNQNQSGRELLEEIAIATIVSIACDIARQRGYETERDREREEDDLFDRGMREYLHGGHPDIKVPIPFRRSY